MGLTTEKQAVVFDFGNEYTKVGYAGEPAPRSILPTELRCPETGRIQRVFDAVTFDEKYDLLVEFIHTLYFRHLLVSPKDRRVIIVESVLCPTTLRNMLAKIFFMHFEVSSLLFVPSHVVSLSTLGVNTALVVDMGATETVVIPVFENVAVLHAWQAQPLGSFAVKRQITDMLKKYESPELFRTRDCVIPATRVKVEKTEPQEASETSAEAGVPEGYEELEEREEDFNYITEKHIEDIKVRTCFVTSLARVQKAEEGNPCPPPPNVDYLIGRSSRIVNISGEIRENAYNVLFEQDGDHISVPTMILDAISKCPVDMRKPLAENVLLIGGTAMATGMRARICEELKSLVVSPQYCDKLKVRTFKFHTPPAKENFAAWLGAAIYGASDIVSTRSLSKEAYLRDHQVPDWVSLIHNVFHDGTKRSL